jgi:hypothetical protein
LVFDCDVPVCERELAVPERIARQVAAGRLSLRGVDEERADAVTGDRAGLAGVADE